MDKVMPPNGSPEEIQAWNNMMDTMVTFIKASTHLMNTITQKVRPLPGGPGMLPPAAVPPDKKNILANGCEPECEICLPKPRSPPPCGVCKANKTAASSARTHPVGSRTRSSSETPVGSNVKAPSTPTSNVQVVVTPPTPQQPARGENNEEGDDVVGEGKVTEGGGAADEAEVDQPAAVDGGGSEVPAEAAEEATAPPASEEAADPPASEEAADPPASEATIDPPASEEIPVAPTPEEAQIQGSPPSPGEAPGPPAGEAPETTPAGDTQIACVCSAIRSKKLEEEKKSSCSCPKDDQSPGQPPQEPTEIRICGCGPTAGNQAAMVQDMVQKLANAQQEIDQLQEEMARLQRMDTSRRTGSHGGPNPAALYREIMRDNPLHDRTATERPSGRIPPHVRQRLFQTGTSVNSTMERSLQSPGNQFSHIRQSLCPPNNGIPHQNSSLFGTSGFEMTPIPAEGRQLPEGYVGCIPCEANRAPSALGGTPERQRQSPMQGRSIPSGPQQCTMFVPKQHMGASRPGVIRPAQAPFGGNSGFRSLQSFQDSPGATYGGSSVGAYGSTGVGSMMTSYMDLPDSPPRRIVMCGPPPQPQIQNQPESQSNCLPGCQNR